MQMEMQHYFGIHENASTRNSPTSETNHKDETAKEQQDFYRMC